MVVVVMVAAVAAVVLADVDVNVLAAMMTALELAMPTL